MVMPTIIILSGSFIPRVSGLILKYVWDIVGHDLKPILWVLVV